MGGSVYEWVSMCVRNLSERILLWSRISYSDPSVRISNSTEMSKRLYFSQKPEIKWCKKFFSGYVTQKGLYFSTLGPLN